MKIQIERVVLLSKENEPFILKTAEALLSNTIKKIMLEFPNKTDLVLEIPLFQFSSYVISKIVEYCKIYSLIQNQYPKTNLGNGIVLPTKNKHIENFFKISVESLLKITLASDFLEIEELTSISSRLIAAFITKGEILV
mmetsp:Transcript_17673/g.27341  ORF Transcript_17673/g.27341 Transcript_17673/m.27341 type:complete len:139 (+) Transcript_17673:256-672(+)